MAIPDTSGSGGVRHVRCPKCHSVLQEPSGVPVYQCGGCGASLKAKIRSGDAHDAAVGAAPSPESVLPPPRLTSPRLSQSARLGTDDAATTSAPASTPDTPATVRHEGAGNLTPEREHHASVQEPPSVERKGRDHRSADQGEADGSSGRHRGRGAVSAPNTSANFSRSIDAAAELQDSEERRQPEPEPVDAMTKRGSELQYSERRREGQSEPVDATAKRGSDDVTAAAVAEEKAPSPPPRHALSPQKMSPLHEKILKTVDGLKDDLSELFSKSPELKPSTPPRTPRHPTQEGHASRPAIPTSRHRHAAASAALHRRVNAGYTADKHGQAAPRGLPSRRYRRCRADPCGGYNARSAGPCRRHSCCDHGKPECGSCRGHCCGSSRAREPARPQAAVAEAKRRAPPPKQHCRPVLKGAPFIVCSSCFTLVQVPAGFAVPSARVRDLRCGACSAVLSYSYRDPDRKKPVDLGSSPARHVGGARPDLFSFIEDFAGGVSSYSTTEDERPLHVSRNSSFDTVVAAEETGALPQRQSNSLHRLMGYGSARELLLRRSPSLYEYGSFDKRSTPPSDASRRYVDRKGKAVCLDTDDDVAADDDSDDSGALRPSNVRRRAGWGIPTPGAIRIRS